MSYWELLTSTGVQTNVSAFSDEVEEVSKKNKLNQKPLIVVDGTSEIGGVQRDFSKMDVYFGSVQKFMGCPAGLSVMIVSPRAMHNGREGTGGERQARKGLDLSNISRNETEKRRGGNFII